MGNNNKVNGVVESTLINGGVGGSAHAQKDGTINQGDYSVKVNGTRGVADRISYEEAYKWEEAERAKREDRMDKEQRRKERIAAIGDGISALSNLYFATKGAPNMYDAANSLSEASRVRYDRMKEDYRAKREAYLSGLQNAQRLDILRDAEDRRARREVAKAEKEAKDRERALKQVDREYNYKVSKDNADREVDRERIAATRSNGKKKSFLGYEYDDDAGYNRLVLKLAKEYGIQVDEDVVKTVTDENSIGNFVNRRIRTEKSKGNIGIDHIAAAVEREYNIRNNKGEVKRQSPTK